MSCAHSSNAVNVLEAETAFAHTRIVLLKTSHPGNIGSSARAMATMGFSHLSLVQPKTFPHVKADEMAVGAKKLLDTARIYQDVASAVSDCTLVFGVTARVRDYMPPVLTVRQAIAEWRQQAIQHPTAFVFGNERNGLENETLWQCDRLVTIPVNPHFSSLNLASAVQLICYEARLAILDDGVPSAFDHTSEMATHNDIQHLIAHFEVLMKRVAFISHEKSMPIYAKLRIMFHRLQLERQDVRLLRGFLHEIERELNRLEPIGSEVS